MGKTLNELARSLKELIEDLQSDAHNIKNFNSARYNNLKFKMDIAKNSNPHVVIAVAMSEATFDLKTGEKLNGSLGPDEKYVIRWLGKSENLESLRENWGNVEKNRGKARDKEE